ncbi:polycystin-2-like [Oscarella lobularis]|uniref:polycystin-2-like n=1 Tax=Oscarella lobularis TaxID=121494 RepID=UPI003313ECB5
MSLPPSKVEPIEMSQRPPSVVSEAWSRKSNVEERDSMKRKVDDDDPERGISAKPPLKWWKRVWQTRFTLDTSEDANLRVKTTIRELVTYIFFLVILCIVTYGMAGSTSFYYTKAMKDLFVDDAFTGIGSQDDFWPYAEGTLLDGLYWEEWYNNQNYTADELGYIFHENKLLGLPRMRQLRVRKDSCSVQKDFQDEIKDCYGSYSSAAEDTSAFGLINGTAWTYSSSSEIAGRSFAGLLATYSGGGYYQLLNKTKSQTTQEVASLKNNLWTDRGTRVVFIDFTVYNANVNLFCVVKLIIEFPPSGGAFISSNVWSIKLLRYVTSFDYFILACEIIFVLFIVYYTIEEILEITVSKLKYFKNVWNCLDVLMILISIVAIAFNIYRTVTVKEKLQTLLNESNQYANFEDLGYWQIQYNNMVGVLVFFAWFKIFKYISFNKTMNQLSLTLAKCAKDVFGFCVIFFIVFFAYAQLGYLIFGAQIQDYETFGSSVFTLFRIILGDFDFQALESANRILGPIFFVTYVFFVFFVLLNMFLAIINDTYGDVKSDKSKGEDEFRISDYLLRGFTKLKEKLNYNKKKMETMQTVLDTRDNDDMKFDEWKKKLKQRGYSDADIETGFSKYDFDGDRVLTAEERQQMAQDLKMKISAINKEMSAVHKASNLLDRDTLRSNNTKDTRENGTEIEEEDEEEGGQVTIEAVEEYAILSRRVDRLEHALGSVVSKIDTVLAKLEMVKQTRRSMDDSQISDRQGNALSDLHIRELQRLEITESQFDKRPKEYMEETGL